MHALSTVLTVVLALLCMASAGLDFTRRPRVIATIDRIGVPPRLIPVLGSIKVLGALGLLIGLGADGLGVAAAIGLVVYFVLAVGLHVRVRDNAEGIAPAAVMCVLSIVTLLTSL